MINFRTSANLVKVLALAAFLLASIQTTASAENLQSANLLNYAGHSIVEFYSCPPGTDIEQNGKNLLEGMPPLNNGASISITYDADQPNYTIKAVFDDGMFAIWENVDCSEMITMTIYKNGEDYKVRIN